MPQRSSAARRSFSDIIEGVAATASEDLEPAGRAGDRSSGIITQTGATDRTARRAGTSGPSPVYGIIMAYEDYHRTSR
jgi:hypothetical protein